MSVDFGGGIVPSYHLLMLHCVLLKYQEKAVEKEATAKKVAQAAAAKKTKQTVKYEDLEMMRVLGAGTFGKVSLVRHRPVRFTKAPGCRLQCGNTVT